MTLRELLTFFEGFYGEKYSGVFLDTMTAYLDGSSSDFYRATASVIVKRFSRTFGKVPGPAEIENNMSEILETMHKPVLLPVESQIRDKGWEKTWHDELEKFKRRITYRSGGSMSEQLSKIMDSIEISNVN